MASSNLDVSDLDKVLSGLMSPAGIDYADLYFQQSHYESWALEDGIVKQGNFGIDSGVGVRAVSQEKTGFASSDDIALAAFKAARQTAQAISRRYGKTRPAYWRRHLVLSCQKGISHVARGCFLPGYIGWAG